MPPIRIAPKTSVDPDPGEADLRHILEHQCPGEAKVVDSSIERSCDLRLEHIAPMQMVDRDLRKGLGELGHAR